MRSLPVDETTISRLRSHIVTNCLPLLQKKDMRELTRSCGRDALTMFRLRWSLYARSIPRPGQRYNQVETRLIEPDVAFVKRDDKYVVLVNDEDMPALRLNHNYRKMLQEKQTEKEVKEYVKERYKSAIQLLRNIEQRKNTIVRTCEVIVRRQTEFLEHGVEALKPMMIKEVAEEIGVHPSTVSRAVANKYVHTPQGVFELRFFFSEGVNGPEGGDLPLVLLKRKVKKLIEDEDPRKPLTDDQLAAELAAAGYPGDAQNGGEVSRRYADSQHPPAPRTLSRRNMSARGSRDERGIHRKTDDHNKETEDADRSWTGADCKDYRQRGQRARDPDNREVQAIQLS